MRVRRALRGTAVDTEMPVLDDARLTALAISFADPELASKVSSYCREAPCTLVQREELEAIRSDVKARVAESAALEARIPYLMLGAALGGLAFGWWTWGKGWGK